VGVSCGNHHHDNNKPGKAHLERLRERVVQIGKPHALLAVEASTHAAIAPPPDLHDGGAGASKDWQGGDSNTRMGGEGEHIK